MFAVPPSAKPSDVPARARALAQAGRVAEAFNLLTTAITARDAHAAAELADWRLSGHLIRRDLAAARDLYGTAAQLGLDAAAPVHIAMLANGAGGSIPRRWSEALTLLQRRAAHDPLAARQCKLISAMAITSDGDPLSVAEAVSIHGNPPIRRLAGFMTADECTYVADRAAGLLQPAVVVDPRSGQFVRDPVRNATAANFPFVEEDTVLHALNRRIAAATGIDVAHGEPLQVLSYRPGEEYKLHSDALPPGHIQRTDTFLVTLSDAFTGGETSFPRIGHALRGAVGEAFHFGNCDAAGQPHPDAWHAGLPVRSGRKLLLSKWLRAAPLDLSGPPGRPF